MAHAYLSPSSAYRAFNCPASVRRSDIVEKRVQMLREIGAEFYGLDENATRQFQASLQDDNQASSDGTALHKVFESALLAKAEDEKVIHMLIRQCDASDETKNDDFIVSRMTEVCQEYVRYCNQEGVSRSVEKRVKVRGLPQFGTVDLATRDGRTLGVRDLKTGRIEVSPENNYQLLCYAVGLLDEYGWDNFDEVELEIIGIRFPSQSVTVPVSDVKKFKVDVMLPAFFDAYSIQPSVKTGEWCQYCSAKLYCNEWLEQNDKVFDNVFMSDMSEKTNQELEDLYYRFKEVETLVKNEVTTELLSRFDTFNEPTGVVRVQGGEAISWKASPEEVEKTLGQHVEPEQLYKRSIKTPKQIKALLGEQEELVENLVKYSTKKPYLKKK